MKITFYGHNCLGIEIKGKHILIDPFITGNDLAKEKIDINSLKADYILLTHAHSDHTLDAEAIAKNTGAVIVSNFEITTYYEKKGIEVHPMNLGGNWKFDFGRVKFVAAQHTSDKVMGVHYDTFGFIEIDHEEAKRKFYDAGKDLMLLEIGESLEL